MGKRNDQPRSQPRARVVLVVAALVVGGTFAMPSIVGPDRGEPVAEAAGDRMPEDAWRQRTDDYLAYVTAQGLAPGSVDSVLAHAERHERDPSFAWDANSAGPQRLRGPLPAARAVQGHGRLRHQRLPVRAAPPRRSAAPRPRRRVPPADPGLQVLVDRADPARHRRLAVLLDGEPLRHLPGERVHRRPDLPRRGVHQQRDDRSPAHGARPHAAAAMDVACGPASATASGSRTCTRWRT